MQRIPVMMGACVVLASGACHAPSALSVGARAGHVVLHCDPADAEVTLDGIPMGLCSDYASGERGLPVGTGTHRLRFRKPGHRSLELDVAPDVALAVVHARLERAVTEENRK
jgi:hypothetical protein